MPVSLECFFDATMAITLMVCVFWFEWTIVSSLKIAIQVHAFQTPERGAARTGWREKQQSLLKAGSSVCAVRCSSQQDVGHECCTWYQTRVWMLCEPHSTACLTQHHKPRWTWRQTAWSQGWMPNGPRGRVWCEDGCMILAPKASAVSVRLPVYDSYT